MDRACYPLTVDEYRRFQTEHEQSGRPFLPFVPPGSLLDCELTQADHEAAQRKMAWGGFGSYHWFSDHTWLAKARLVALEVVEAVRECCAAIDDGGDHVIKHRHLERALRASTTLKLAERGETDLAVCLETIRAQSTLMQAKLSDVAHCRRHRDGILAAASQAAGLAARTAPDTVGSEPVLDEQRGTVTRGPETVALKGDLLLICRLCWKVGKSRAQLSAAKFPEDHSGDKWRHDAIKRQIVRLNKRLENTAVSFTTSPPYMRIRG